MARMLLLVGLLLQSGCFLSAFVPGIPGSGTVVTVDIPVSEFSKLHHSTVGTVNLKVGAEESVSITTDDNLQSHLEAVVEDGELILRNKGEENLKPTKGIVFDITVKSLKSVRLSGVGSITAEGIAEPELTVNSTGVGSVKVKGSAETLTVNVDGVGSFDSGELEAKTVVVTSTGVGSTKVKATESLSVTATGVGAVTYTGQPKVLNISDTGVGRVSAAN
jgi:hypothetical protein